ncbi:MAG: peptide-methionine (R)-S-oxide reductase MsrB [bacterium]|nr:peptide-methionine (R)-S-oxide reductase MsrB [bacterium]
MAKKINDDDFKKRLSDAQYRVLREGGTEAPGSGKFDKYDKPGVYKCAACGQELFSSDEKFDSNMPGLVGWPAFSDALSNNAIELADDNSGGMKRTEIKCSKCGSHLGHLFEDDSASKNGKHYCVNSVALDFNDKKK